MQSGPESGSMSRRPSATSSGLLLNGFSTPDASRRPSPTVSLKLNPILFEEVDSVDPEEYFTNSSVSEVKSALNRLRSDADAKQEELRMMVGERYHDLSRASTSILSIAESSQEVLDALNTTKKTLKTERSKRRAETRWDVAESDARSQMLQSLAARLQLLSDASEQLFRLLERQRYLQATFLYLLARVVYRSMVHEAQYSESRWRGRGISVLDKFPVAQRHWDTIAHFRSQISHQATLAIRERTISIENGCASFIALHLLDSLPLPEALNVLLDQRTEALHNLESKIPEPRLPSQGNLESFDKKTGKQPAATVWYMLEAALDVVSRTVHIVREIFHGTEGKSIPIMSHMLSSLGSDLPWDAQSLPMGSSITSQKVLSGVPLSTRFSLHPADVKLYKAFVDDTLSSFSLPLTTLTDTLHAWFSKATSYIEFHASGWFNGLTTLKDVSQVYSFVIQWSSTQKDLRAEEASDLMAVINNTYRSRVQVLWKTALHEIKVTFDAQLSTFGSQEEIPSATGTQAEELAKGEASTILSVPPLPRIEWAGGHLPATPSSFTAFRSAIRQRADGKVAHVATLVNTIETEAHRLQHDLQQAIDRYDDNGHLMRAYASDADALSVEILDSVSSILHDIPQDSDTVTTRILSIASTSSSLSSSPFVSSLGCSDAVREKFYTRIRSLYEELFNRWRTHVSSIAVAKYRRSYVTSDSRKSTDDVTNRDLSTAMMEALLVVVDQLNRWAMFCDPDERQRIAQSLLRQFVADIIQDIKIDMNDHDSLWCDLAFLRVMLRTWGVEDSLPVLDKAISSLTKQTAKVSEITTDVQRWPQRTQCLLFPLVASPVIQPAEVGVKQDSFGRRDSSSSTAAPPTSRAMPVIKPSPRFGLLLVGGNVTVSS